MKLLSGTLKDAQARLSLRRELVLFSILYLFNCFTFSSYTRLLSQTATEPWLPLAWLYGLAALVPLYWRNRAPVSIFIVECVLTVVAWPFLPLYSPVVGIPVALYSIASNCDKNVSALALIASLIPSGLAAIAAGFAAAERGQQVPATTSTGVFLGLAAFGAYVAGRLTRASRQHIKDLEREQRAAREAEEREHAAAREAQVVSAERRKIARDLHDSISHAVTVIVLLAAGATRIVDTSSAQAKQSLMDIETTAKETMDELRRLLAVLNSAGNDGSEPQLGLADLTALLDSVQKTGMLVTVYSEGVQHTLQPNVESTAYRIVQEGLTNVLKHAGKNANPQLRLVWKPQSLLIQIDNGTDLAKQAACQTSTGGWGLRGLSERARAVGGYLNAGPYKGAGYRLTAILPAATPAISSGFSSTIVSRASLRSSENKEQI